MKKTPLAKQIAYVKSKQNEYKIGSDAYNALREVEIVMSAGLEEERQNLMDARKHGRESMLLSSGIISDEQYLTENYQQ